MKCGNLIGLFGISVLLSGCVSTGGSTIENGVNYKDTNIFKGVTEVTIPQFTVGFVYQDAKNSSVSGTASRALSKSTAEANSSSTLGIHVRGLTDKLLMKMTDEAYDDLVSRLEANGYKVNKKPIMMSAPKWVLDEYKKHQKIDTIVKNCDYYQPFSNAQTYTVSAKGIRQLCNGHKHIWGLAAETTKKRPIVVDYLLHVGYLEKTASTASDNFLGRAYANTGVKLHEGMQTYWHSGIHMYESRGSKGVVQVHNNIGSDNPIPGRLSLAGENTIRYGKAKYLELQIDPAKYYRDGMKVLKKTNEKLVAAMVASR